MLDKNNKQECFDALDDMICHVTFKKHLPNIFKKGLSDFWFGDDVNDCYNMVVEGSNHSNFVEEDVVIIFFPKSAMKLKNCNFAVDSGDGYSNEWFRTGIYNGTIKPNQLTVINYESEENITNQYTKFKNKGVKNG